MTQTDPGKWYNFLTFGNFTPTSPNTRFVRNIYELSGLLDALVNDGENLQILKAFANIEVSSQNFGTICPAIVLVEADGSLSTYYGTTQIDDDLLNYSVTGDFGIKRLSDPINLKRPSSDQYYYVTHCRLDIRSVVQSYCAKYLNSTVDDEPRMFLIILGNQYAADGSQDWTVKTTFNIKHRRVERKPLL